MNELSDRPTSADVMRRAFLFASMMCKCSLETAPENRDALEVYGRLISWFEPIDFGTVPTSDELKFLRTSLGSCDSSELTFFNRVANGLPILAWALNLTPFPTIGVVDQYCLTDDVGLMVDDPNTRLNSVQLRSEAEISICRELLYAVHTRVRDYLRNQQQRDISHWFDETWFQTLGIKTVLSSKGDLLLSSSEISTLTNYDVQRYETMLSEWHRASIWLQENESYYQISVDT